jgi:hypothetical protein
MAGECRPARCGECLRGSSVAQRQGPDSPSADRSPCHSSHVRASLARGDRRRGCGDLCGTCRHDVVAGRRTNDSTASPPGDSAICQPLRSRPAHYSLAVRRTILTRRLRRRWPPLASQGAYLANQPTGSHPGWVTGIPGSEPPTWQVTEEQFSRPTDPRAWQHAVAAARPRPHLAVRHNHQPPDAHVPEALRGHRPAAACLQYPQSPGATAG